MSKKEPPRKRRNGDKLIKGKKVPAAASSKDVSPAASPIVKKKKVMQEVVTTDPASLLNPENISVTIKTVLESMETKVAQPSAISSSTPQTTVSSDVMEAVNRQIANAMKAFNQQQAEIRQMKENEKEMLQIVLTSKECQDVLNAKVKKLESENR